jgi:hypothetical protein
MKDLPTGFQFVTPLKEKRNEWVGIRILSEKTVLNSWPFTRTYQSNEGAVLKVLATLAGPARVASGNRRTIVRGFYPTDAEIRRLIVRRYILPRNRNDISISQ